MKVGMLASRMAVPIVLAALACLGSMAAHAALISYEGNLTSGSVVTGSVGGFGMVDDDASSVDFWTISGNAGKLITLQGTRLNSPLDLVLSLYLGKTTADTVLFVHDASFGGITWIGMGDDEVPPPGNLGPFGDPLLRMTLPVTGIYTIAIGGYASDSNGPFGYRLFATVPTPATLPLFLLGIVVAFAVRRYTASRNILGGPSSAHPV